MPVSGRQSVRLAWFALAGAVLLCVAFVALLERLEERRLLRVLDARAELLGEVIAEPAVTPDPAAALRTLAASSAGIGALALVDPATLRVLAGSTPEWAGSSTAALPASLQNAGGVWRRTEQGRYVAARVLRESPAGPGTLLLLELDVGELGVLDSRTRWGLALTATLVIAALGLGVVLAWHLESARRRAVADRQTAVQRSEERLQLAVAGSNDALFDYDPVTGHLHLSDVFRRWLGGAGTGAVTVEINVDRVLSRIHPDHVDRVLQAFLECSRDGRSFDVEFPLEKPDGGHLWLQVRGRGVDQGGDRYRVSGFASDISRRKVAESLLHDTVDRLGAVLDNIAEGIITLDHQGRVCAVNAAAQHMFGLDRDAFVGRQLAALMVLPGDAGDWSALADRQPRESRVLPGDATGFAAEFAVSSMNVRSDERFIVVLRDVTERKVAEDRLRAAMEETQAATRAKDEFLATMSHEIRTPMNGVLGMTQLLLDMDLTGPQRETAQLIRSSGQSLLTIINDILDFSRAGSGRLKVDAVPFDLRRTVREVVELLGRRRSPVDLYVDYPLEVPARLVGDPGRVRQVLMNLVGNALKFTGRGHVVVTVAPEPVDGAADADVFPLRITVEDTGPGIPLAAQESLFEPFTQADASTTRRFGGTGLGLAISRRLVELMGGEIGLESTPDVGSRFHFTLRLPVAPDGFDAGAPAALAGRRVLLVDDNDRGRNLLESYLSRAGLRVHAVGSAPAALEVLERERFDVALVDDQMPGMDGLLLSELIRIDATWASMRLVLMCMADIRGLDESRAADRTLVKPVMPDFLLHELYTLLTGSAGAAVAALASASTPVPAPTPGAVGLDAPRVLAARTLAPRPSPAVRPQPRVLLAEDNVVNQKVAVRMLEKLGCSIDVAVDGAEAVEMWRHFAYDLIFMDCQMPQLDGLEATREIRAEERGRGRLRTPVVAMTANAMHQDRSDCLAAGMDDYLSKPVSQEELQAALGRWLGLEPVQKRSDGTR